MCNRRDCSAARSCSSTNGLHQEPIQPFHLVGERPFRSARSAHSSSRGERCRRPRPRRRSSQRDRFLRLAWRCSGLHSDGLARRHLERRRSFPVAWLGACSTRLIELADRETAAPKRGSDPEGLTLARKPAGRRVARRSGCAKRHRGVRRLKPASRAAGARAGRSTNVSRRPGQAGGPSARCASACRAGLRRGGSGPPGVRGHFGRPMEVLLVVAQASRPLTPASCRGRRRGEPNHPASSR
jgi:hypothetical protein